MPDLYARIGEVAPEVQERLAGVLEMRAADARQREMLKSYLSEIAFPKDARALEIGCGTGAVTRTLAGWPGVSKAIGIDPSATFIAKARELSKGIPDVLVQNGRISSESAEALKAEARRRSKRKEWFGHIAFASVLARKARGDPW